MRRYVMHRLLLAVPVVIIVTFGTFFLVHIIPGDVAVLRLGGDATDEELDAFREANGLNRPIIVQYVDWVGSAARGDFGVSFWERREISEVVREKLPVTFELAFLAVAYSAAVGIPLGVISAVKQDSILDQALRFTAILFLAVPAFWLAILMITFPSIWWGWKPPTSGFEYVWDAPLDNLYRMSFPSFVVGASTMALVLRLTRSTMLEVLRADYVRTARAKGLASRVVIGKHALRNALIPVLTILGLQLSVLLGGSVIAEQVFALPGMGRSMLQGVLRRDYPLIQAYVLIFALVYVLMNLLVDLTYSVLDPRIRYT